MGAWRSVLGAALSAAQGQPCAFSPKSSLPITTPRPDRLPVFPPKWCAPPWPRPNCRATFSPTLGAGLCHGAKRPDVLIYSIGRTAQREKLFKWVGVIAPTQYYLFSLPQRNLKLQRLEDAKEYQIATVNEDVGSST